MAFRKIVVGVDESPAAVHALREAAIIAEAAGAQLLALTVVEDPWRKVEPSEVEGFRRIPGPAPADVAEHRARAGLEALVQGALGPGGARVAVQFGLASVELARRAEMEGADLLVLGRQPTGDLARRPTGRTLRGTLARARMPCLVVPFGQRTWRRVLAALGAGPAAAAVDEVATAFAALWGAVPTTVHAEPGGRAPAPAVVTDAANGPATATAGTIVYGDPVGEILKTARELSTDALVIGFHRGETTAEAGRVAPHLLERAPCAVLTVPV